MRGASFVVLVLCFVALLWVLHWLFAHFDISHGVIREGYVQILVYGLPLFFITTLYDQQLQAIGWPKVLRILPATLLAIELILPNLSDTELMVLRGVNLAFLLAVAIKGKKRVV